MSVPSVIIAAVIAIVAIIMMVPGPVVPGIIVPWVPGPAAIVPGAVPIVIVSEVPGPVIPGIGIIQRPEGRSGIHDGEHRRGAFRGEAHLIAGGHHKGVALAENIGRRLFTQSKEIIRFFIAYNYLWGGRRRCRVDAVVVDLRLQARHGRAGQGGESAERIGQGVLFHYTTSFYPIKISIFVAGKARQKRINAISVPIPRLPAHNIKHKSAKKQTILWQKR